MALRWVFTADSAPFRRGLNQMRTEAQGFSRSLTRMMAGVFGSAAIIGGFRSWLRNMDDLAKRAQKLGANVEDLQRVEFIGQKAGVDARQLTTLLVRLERRFGEAARGSKEFANSLKNLGIERVGAGDPAQAILALSAAWKKAEGSGTEYADLLKVLDTEARELIPLLRQGPEELAEGMAKAAVVSAKTIERVEKFNDALTDIKNRAQVGFAIVFNGLKFLSDLIGTIVGTIIANWQRFFDFYVRQWKNVFAIVRAAYDRDLQAIKDGVRAIGVEFADAAGDIARNMKSAAELTVEAWDDAFGKIEKRAEQAKAVLPKTESPEERNRRIFRANLKDLSYGGFSLDQDPSAKSLNREFTDMMGSIAASILAFRELNKKQDVASDPIPVTSLRSIGGGSAGGTAGPQSLAREGLRLASLRLAKLNEIAANTSRGENATADVAEPAVP